MVWKCVHIILLLTSRRWLLSGAVTSYVTTCREVVPPGEMDAWAWLSRTGRGYKELGGAGLGPGRLCYSAGPSLGGR